MPTIDTLVEDINKLFTDKHTPSEENLDIFCNSLKELIKNSLSSARNEETKQYLRMSNIGLPDLKLWYMMNSTETRDFQYKGSTLIKFLYGDMLEQLLLLLIREAGHKVSHEQEELELEGIKGHRDCKIDGVPVDIKTASQWGFKKFSEGSLFKDDPFGYIGQLSAYIQAGGDKEGAFLAINKESGEIASLKITPIDTINAKNRIEHIKKVVALPEPPQKKCYDPVPDGKSGNLKLNSNCSYCAFKDKCWASANNGQGLRKFRYSNGIQEFVEVFNTPRVEEILPLSKKDV